jgi:4'-phosphopantetheinyl transferase
VSRNDADEWPVAPRTFTLDEQDVHVWRAGLAQPRATIQRLYDTLAGDERERAARFHFQKDREHFVVARGLLRELLGMYAGRRAGQLRFSYNPYGKPALAAREAEAAPRFNVSHSHGLALFAFARAREVGVDLELIRPELAGEEIAERFFAPEEVASLRALPKSEQAVAFFRCWTRKEAFVKGLSEGLSHPLDQFAVSFAPGQPAALLRAARDPSATARWTLHDLPAGAGYAAALAVEGAGVTLSRRQWLD